jgi:hypothetical protein
MSKLWLSLFHFCFRYTLNRCFPPEKKIPLLASKVNEYEKACLVLLCGWETSCHMTHTSVFASLALQCGGAVFWKSYFGPKTNASFFKRLSCAVLNTARAVEPGCSPALTAQQFGLWQACALSFPPKSTAHPLRHAQVWRPTPKKRDGKRKINAGNCCFRYAPRQTALWCHSVTPFCFRSRKYTAKAQFCFDVSGVLLTITHCRHIINDNSSVFLC